MLRPWRLGKPFGIGLYVHWTFLFLPLFVIVNAWQAGPLQVVFLLALLVAVIACLVLHELGHALMARRFGIGTRDITLYPIGGVASLERMSEKPWEEVSIALAGPAVNVFISTVLGLLALGLYSLSPAWLYSPPGTFLLSLVFANVLLVVFNMLPAFPMDGGRVLRALLALGLGQLRATEIAASIGLVVAFALGVLPVFAWLLLPSFTPNPLLIVVAAFVLIAGQQELAALRRREAWRRSQMDDVLPAEAQPPPPRPEPPTVGFTGAVWDHQQQAWVHWENGRPVAIFRNDRN